MSVSSVRSVAWSVDAARVVAARQCDYLVVLRYDCAPVLDAIQCVRSPTVKELTPD
jgi:hypothetical protein